MDRESHWLESKKRKFESLRSLLKSDEFILAGGGDATPNEPLAIPFPDMTGLIHDSRELPRVPPEVPRDNQAAGCGGELSAINQAMQFGPGDSPLRKAGHVLRSDLNETTEDWISDRDLKESSREVPVSWFAELAGRLSELEPVAQQIEKRFGNDASSVILFASADRFADSKLMTSAVASLLASRATKRVLVIDSDFETGQLSKIHGMESALGLADWLQAANLVDCNICSTSQPTLDFVPVGNRPMECPVSLSEMLGQYLLRFRTSHSYICVNAGLAHGVSVPLWSHFCSGSYVAINKTSSSQVIAESAVSRMKEYESRLLGCITH